MLDQALLGENTPFGEQAYSDIENGALIIVCTYDFVENGLSNLARNSFSSYKFDKVTTREGVSFKLIFPAV